MAHQIENMAYVGQTPWHGLGNQLSPNQPIEVWAQQAGMDWRIESSDVSYMAKNDRGQSIIMPYEEQRVLYRSDTHAPLSVVSQRYQEVQPKQILEFYRDLTEQSGFELETAGVLKGGRKLWALARTGQHALLKGGDQVKGYLLLATACDGTLATTAQFTSVRVVCNNTLAIALERKGQDKAAGIIKVPHSTEFNPEQVKAQLGITVSDWDRFIRQMKQLSNRKVSSSEADNFFQTVLNCNPKTADFSDSDLKNADSSPNSKAALSNERAYKRVQELYGGTAMGAQMESAQGSAWGLLNAVTEFVDHHRRSRSQDNRLDSAWFGQGALIKQAALDEALALL